MPSSESSRRRMSETGLCVLICGGSTRAAGQSAVRAGLTPICADVFADEDLRDVGTAIRITNYPEELFEVAQRVPVCPWMYTGAIENRPRLIARISRSRPLWGIGGSALKRVRDPFVVASVLRSANLPALEHRLPRDAPPPDGRWMLKPSQGGSGRGVRVWDRTAERSPILREPHYFFQERREGEAMSALYVAFPSGTAFVGTSKQIVGDGGGRRYRFRYCGSIVPFEVPRAIEEQIRRVGSVIARECGLCGVFGIDFILDETAAWPIEVNPRYTASVELFERAYGVALLDWHRRACEGLEGADGSSSDLAAMLARSLSAPRLVFGKRIYYTPRPVIVPTLGEVSEAWGSEGWPGIADRPAPGTRIVAGHPVCTVFGEGRDRAECLGQLRERAEELSARLDGSS